MGSEMATAAVAVVAGRSFGKVLPRIYWLLPAVAAVVQGAFGVRTVPWTGRRPLKVKHLLQPMATSQESVEVVDMEAVPEPLRVEVRPAGIAVLVALDGCPTVGQAAIIRTIKV